MVFSKIIKETGLQYCEDEQRYGMNTKKKQQQNYNLKAKSK